MESRPQRRTKAGRLVSTITREELQSCFHMPSEQACRHLGVGLTILKRVCRRFGIPRWPYNRQGKHAHMDDASGESSALHTAGAGAHAAGPNLAHNAAAQQPFAPPLQQPFAPLPPQAQGFAPPQQPAYGQPQQQAQAIAALSQLLQAQPHAQQPAQVPLDLQQQLGAMLASLLPQQPPAQPVTASLSSLLLGAAAAAAAPSQNWSLRSDGTDFQHQVQLPAPQQSPFAQLPAQASAVQHLVRLLQSAPAGLAPPPLPQLVQQQQQQQQVHRPQPQPYHQGAFLQPNSSSASVPPLGPAAARLQQPGHAVGPGGLAAGGSLGLGSGQGASFHALADAAQRGAQPAPQGGAAHDDAGASDGWGTDDGDSLDDADDELDDEPTSPAQQAQQAHKPLAPDSSVPVGPAPAGVAAAAAAVAGTPGQAQQLTELERQLLAALPDLSETAGLLRRAAEQLQAHLMAQRLLKGEAAELAARLPGAAQLLGPSADVAEFCVSTLLNLLAPDSNLLQREQQPGRGSLPGSSARTGSGPAGATGPTAGSAAVPLGGTSEEAPVAEAGVPPAGQQGWQEQQQQQLELVAPAAGPAGTDPFVPKEEPAAHNGPLARAASIEAGEQRVQCEPVQHLAPPAGAL